MQMKKIKFPKAAQWPIQPVGTVCEAGGGGTLQIRPADASGWDPEHKPLTFVSNL